MQTTGVCELLPWAEQGGQHLGHSPSLPCIISFVLLALVVAPPRKLPERHGLSCCCGASSLPPLAACSVGSARCPQPSPSSAQHSRLGGVTGTCARGSLLLQGLLFGDAFTEMAVTCHTLPCVRVDQWLTVSTELCISHQPILGHFLYLKKKLGNLSCPLPHSPSP